MPEDLYPMWPQDARAVRTVPAARHVNTACPWRRSVYYLGDNTRAGKGVPMPTLVIVDRYSHMLGEAVLRALSPAIQREIEEIITTTSVLPATKVSEEKTKRGRLVW